MKKYYIFECSNGVKYRVPVMFIAQHRANYYKKEFNDDIERSLKEDTIPLFTDDEFEISDWARNSMNWEDVKHIAEIIKLEKELDMEDEWCNPESIDYN